VDEWNARDGMLQGGDVVLCRGSGKRILPGASGGWGLMDGGMGLITMSVNLSGVVGRFGLGSGVGDGR
jgi:hypothetical protein